MLGKNPGAVNVAAAGGAYTLVLVVAHEQAGQRDLSTPGLKQNLTDSLKARKQQVARAAYVAAARSDAEIVNYLARRLVEGKGTLPNCRSPQDLGHRPTFYEIRLTRPGGLSNLRVT